jgi:hypothetical protein
MNKGLGGCVVVILGVDMVTEEEPAKLQPCCVCSGDLVRPQTSVDRMMTDWVVQSQLHEQSFWWKIYLHPLLGTPVSSSL